MRFEYLNDENFLLFASKHYENPQGITYDDFLEDLKRFKYIKRLFKRYEKTGELKTHLILNHIIVLYNIFGDAATPMLFYKIDQNLWPSIKAFIVFLDKLPEHPRTRLHDIEMDETCLTELERISNGKTEN